MPVKTKMAAMGPKMADGVWKDVIPIVFGRSGQLSLYMFFDPRTPSMRKGCDREKWEKNGKKNKQAGTCISCEDLSVLKE